MSQSLRTARGLTAVLTGSMIFLSQTAFAQTDPTKTERLHAQMQAAAAAAAGAQPAAAPAVPNPNCTLIVPKNTLTAAGLATPFQLTATDPAQGACNESNAAQAAFVQGAIFDPATGAISIYNPVVVDKGDNPLVPPVVPTLPDGAIVALWFGYNGNNLLLQNASGTDSLADANCVNGLNGNNIFGQFSYCNAPAFFTAANAAVAAGKLTVPASGTASDGKPCPTVRDFAVVDQDQSDNVTTVYLVSPRGHISQFTAKNQAAHASSKPMGNASDNRLVDVFVQPALGCKPWVAPDLADPGSMVPALPLNELQARANQPAPVAMVPVGDPMTLDNGNASSSKTSLYRKGVDQPTVDSHHDADTARYCRHLLRISPERMFANQKVFSAFRSPDPAAANSLFTFLAQRFVATYQLLNCQNLVDNLADPVSVTVDGNGVAVTATLNTAALTKAVQRIQGQEAEDNAADSVAREQRSSL